MSNDGKSLFSSLRDDNSHGLFGSLKGKSPPKPLIDPNFDDLKNAVNSLREENTQLREAVRQQAKGLHDLQALIHERFTALSGEMTNMHKNMRSVAENDTEQVQQLQSNQNERLEKLLAFVSQAKN